MPLLPLVLEAGGRSTEARGLLDTGSAVNVLPYQLGQALGLEWDAQKTIVRLSGNLARHEARAVRVAARVGGFSPVWLGFAWTQANGVPLLLGQVNFFMEFDVCFFRSQQAFEVRARS